jgi:hypothetical protein
MTTDPYLHDDAAYVLGALSPVQRRAFEEHLAGCPACSSAVNEVAGLPGLLAALDESSFTGSVDTPPVPETLLPQLLRQVRRERRRSRLAAGVGLAAAALLAVALIGVAFRGGSSTDPQADAPRAQPMTQVQQDVVSATMSFEQVAWGTRMHLSCTYHADDWGETNAPSYALIVHPRRGAAQQVATWRAAPGKTTELDAATDLDPGQISAVDVILTRNGQRLLTIPQESVPSS